LQGFPFDDFDLHDVMLPEDEGDFGYASDDDEIDEEEVVTETGFGSVIGEPLFMHCAIRRSSASRGTTQSLTAFSVTLAMCVAFYSSLATAIC
jgi:hypothetical protein